METITLNLPQERVEALRAIKVCTRDAARIVNKSPQTILRRVKRRQLHSVSDKRGKFLFRLYDILLLAAHYHTH